MLITEQPIEQQKTNLYYPVIARPKISENEAKCRIIAISKLVDIFILLVYISSTAPAKISRKDINYCESARRPGHNTYFYLGQLKMRALLTGHLQHFTRTMHHFHSTIRGISNSG
jgi:hypothetical protein